jgi:uncharacterized protein (UPF0210 family)
MGTTANRVGTSGTALALELIVERGAFSMTIVGEGEGSLPVDETNAIIKAVADGRAYIRPLLSST